MQELYEDNRLLHIYCSYDIVINVRLMAVFLVTPEQEEALDHQNVL